MRLNRKWLYLGGLVTILTLLLTLTLVLPAGAVGQLDPGSLDTDSGYVSPDADLEPADRMIEVTLTNSNLDDTLTVEKDGNFEAVTIEVREAIAARTTSSIRAEIDSASRQGKVEIVLPEGILVGAILPITGGLVIDNDNSSEVVEDAVGTPVIINAAKGLIEIPVFDDLPINTEIVLSYETSPQETALVNVGGDSGDFDLLAVEEVGGPAEYLASFEVADQVTIRMNSAVGGTAPTITHEQHSVPSGLEGNLEIENEEINRRYWDAELTMLIEDDPQTADANEGELEAPEVFYVQVANPPLRDRNGTGSGGLADDSGDIEEGDSDFSVTKIQDAVQGIVKLTVAAGRTLEEDEAVEIDYRGSDSFYIEVDHGPIQGMLAPISGSALDSIIVVPSGTDAGANSGDSLALISIGKGVDTLCDDCRIRLGVVTGNTLDDEDDDDPVPLSRRISVLGISYQGSQRIGIGANREAGDTFTGKLDFDPVNVNGDKVGDEEIINDQDIEVLGSSLASGDRIEVTRVEGRIVTFTLAALTETTDGDDTVDVAYAVRTGANPRNALLPNEAVRPTIAVSAGSRATITSDNDRATVDAEVDPPTFSNPSPSHRDATDDDTQVISVDITDDLAGVDQKSVELTVTVGATPYVVANKDLSFVEIGGGVRASIALDDVEDKGSGKSPRIDDDETTTVRWETVASDNAGNSGTSDAVPDEEGEDETQGNQPYTFNVDGENAVLNQAYTGDWFNTVDDRVEGDRRLGVDDYLPGVSDNTSVRVVFNEALDGASVSADDFTVDDAVPIAAQWYGEGETGSDADDIAQSVFLTVPAMVADATPVVELVGAVSDKAGNSTPSGSKAAFDGIAPSPVLSVDKGLGTKTVTVTVETDERIRTLSPTLHIWVSDALDKGFESLDEVDTFTVGLEDKLDPESPLVLRDMAQNVVASGGELAHGEKISLTLSKAPLLDANASGEVNHNDVAVTSSTNNDDQRDLVEISDDEDDFNAQNGEVTVTIAKADDEDLVAGDTITVTYRGTDPDPARGLVGVPNPSGKQETSTSWTFTLNVTRDDRFAATATVEDRNRNSGTGGIGDPTNDNATVFEIDSALAGGEAARTEPTHDPSGHAPVSISSPFIIELFWDGSKSGDEAFVAGSEGNEYPGDSSNVVTLTKAALDGTNVLDTAVSQSANTFRLSISDISLGAHTLTYNAEDALGNTNATDRVLKFSVQPVPTWDLRLSTGMNLISLPSNPISTNVNDVFGATEEIELIFTFEGAQSKVALRNPDNPSEFVGTLDSIDSQHAYWVSSSNAAKVEINIPPTSQLAPPPYIAVSGGQWNLLPVISLEPVDGGAAPGTEIDADDYLGDFRTAFGWNGRSWSKIDPDGETDDPDQLPVKIGMGYWVLYDEDAIITP